METQAHFDLNAAFAEWRNELAAQPSLTPAERHELETHLRDTVAELRRRGLNHDESFWLARRRTGLPRQLGEEFAKANPLRAWRDRAFWITSFLLVSGSWGMLWNSIAWSPTASRGQFQNTLADWILARAPAGLRPIPLVDVVNGLLTVGRLVPLLALAYFAATGRPAVAKRAVKFITASRKQYVLAALALWLSTLTVRAYGLSWPPWLFLVGQVPTCLLITMGAWLMQPKKEPSEIPQSGPHFFRGSVRPS